MRVALISDSHFDHTSRFEECIRVHDWIAADIAEQRVDLVLHGGDLFERKSTAEERLAVAMWLRKVADVAPVVLVRGNHDAPGELALFAKLRAQHPITVFEEPGVLGWRDLGVACLPWPRKAELLARAPGADASELLRDVLRGLGSQLDEAPGRPRILLTHAMVSGSVTSTGQPLVGQDMEVSLADLALARADVVCLGHIHMGQSWNFSGPVIYPGSPRRTSYGETESKGYALIEIEGNGSRWKSWRMRETPCAPMLLVEAEMADAVDVTTLADTRTLVFAGAPPFQVDADDVRGAEIRLRYRVSTAEREHARKQAEAWRAQWLSRGAVAVKLEEQVIATSNARVPEVAEASTLRDKLDVGRWQPNALPLEERERRAGLLARLEAV